MSELEDMVARLNDVRSQLEQSSTDELRVEHNDLMVQIQQYRQAEREAAIDAAAEADAKAQAEFEAASGAATATPNTVSGGVSSVNGG